MSLTLLPVLSNAGMQHFSFSAHMIYSTAMLVYASMHACMTRQWYSFHRRTLIPSTKVQICHFLVLSLVCCGHPSPFFLHSVISEGVKRALTTLQPLLLL